MGLQWIGCRGKQSGVMERTAALRIEGEGIQGRRIEPHSRGSAVTEGSVVESNQAQRTGM